MFQRRNSAGQRKRQKALKRRHEKPAKRASRRAWRPEALEDRRMFALLGVEPLGFPIIGYDSGGTVDYDQASDDFSMSAIPLTIDMGGSSGFFFTGTVDLNIKVDGTGALIGGVPGDDLVVTGDVDVDGDFVIDYFAINGPLLTGEILAFGSEDSGGTTDLFDFRFAVTGGQLASFYSGKDIGVTTTSEVSSFAGDFSVDFDGGAKGEIGAIDPLNPDIAIKKYTNGVDADDPADAPEIVAGDMVTFTYEVTNTGDVAFALDDVEVVDDSGTPGDGSDDVSTTSGDIVLIPGSDVGGDSILSPGETWLYEYTTTAQDLDPSEDNCGCDVGTYENFAVVTAPGATDDDVSHYTNPSDAPPCIAYDSGGLVNYDSDTDHFSLDAVPTTTDDGGFFFSGDLDIDIVVDAFGMLVGGVPGDDFVLVGDLDADGDFIVDYSGTLLTGEVISFLAVDSGGTTDTYEFTFMVTGGLLAAQYMGMGLKVTTTSEGSNFAGDFNVDFSGGAKGEICCFCLDDASLSGHKYTDQTGDGISGDDTPLEGVTINLYQDFGIIGTFDGADVLYASDVTDMSGEYSFDMLPPGDYLVQEIVPAGYTPTTPTIYAVTLAAGDHITTGFDFANFELGAISGMKFNDLDGDGTNDGGTDPGLAGWTIQLDKDANGTVDATTVTGPGGTYSFTGLTAGTYRIREVGQVGWTQTTVNPGDVSVVSGTNSGNNNFGNFQLGAISGMKFNDLDGDGTNDGGTDPGLAGWTIQLDKDANGTVDATTVTGPGGTYSFTGLTAGTYRIREVGQVGWTQTTVNPGDVSVVSGTNSTGKNFGNFQLGAISGMKFNDLDGDGTNDGGTDPGLAGWTIQLDKDANGTVDATTVTGPGGTYSFTGLTAGTYRIREVGQVGWTQTTVNPGDVSVVSGTNSTGKNFGNRQLVPGIDIEKTTNGPTNSNPTAPDYDNEDAENGPGVPILMPGSTVTWTYKVTNTGETTYTPSQIVVVDDNGTPGNAADDMSTTNGQITFQSVQFGDADAILEPGEIWLYTASGIVADQGGGPAVTFNFSGSSALDGSDGNIRTFTAGGISVKTSAWSRDTSGVWSTAWLGSYGGGLGVTDSSEGDGSNNSHTVDNLTRDNYVLFEFSDEIVIDSAFLGYVVEDSDLKIWIGTKTDPFTNHQTLSDAFLTSLGFTEVNETTLTTTRLADLNAAGISGNVIVIAANTGEPTTEDKFKIEKMTVAEHACYENRAVITVPGATDSDLSHYCTTEGEPGIDIKKYTNGQDADTESGAPQIAPGDTVTWTYVVTNTGTTSFTAAQVVVTDDAGSPGQTADDFHPTRILATDVGNDGILSPGEMWSYEASDMAMELGNAPASTFNFSGSSAVTGTAGNIRTFSAGGVSVKTSAFSRDTSGVWSTAWLGSYGGGLGVTDSSENGASDTHTVDNIGRDNYVLFEFSETVIVDSAYLGYVVEDSDLKIWIGNATDPFTNHLTLNDAILASLGFTEVNETTLTTARLADLNAGGISGNVIVIAANTGEPTTEDKFKIEKLTFEQHLCYANLAVVTTGPGGPTDSDASHYCNPMMPALPGIDIEKLTNGVDADNEADAPEIAAGNTVTWTYKVTNTGTVAFSASEVVVRDDNGTSGNTADDFSPTLVASSDVGNDGILSPGEMWTYTASAPAQELLSPGAPSTFNFSGSSASTGTTGNIRTFSAGGVSVKTSAFSRDTSGVWSTAYLGSYSGGLGVTDGSENGASDTHTVDNSGRDNYVLFEFNQTVVIDSAFLGYVVNDSDLKIWIGTKNDPFTTHQTLSDSFLTSLGFTEVNETTLTTTRLADLNAGGLAGNVLVIAANTGEPSTEDKFKIQKLTFNTFESGVYRNVGTVTADGASDQDVSHYKNPDCVDISYTLTGNTAVTGTKGNIKTYTSNNVSVNASAFSRTTAGAWSTAYLGAYADGLGVTDPSENGSSGTNRIENIGQLNFLVFEFSTQVTIDRAYLDSVSGDSDATVFIGTFDNPFHNHLTLSDALFSSMSYADTNTGGSTARWADFNPDGVQGNVLIIAANVSETNDQFKVSKLDVCAKATKFYVVDATADKTFEYGPSGQALAEYKINSANLNARGVATTAAGDKVWVLDSNKKVYVYDVDGKLLSSWTASGLTTPEDITTNGTDIWIVDDGSNKVFKFAGAASAANGATLTATSSFALNSANANAKGIVTNGTHLWVVNDTSTTDKVFKYTTSGTLAGSWTIDSRNGSPTGITIDPTNVSNIWIVDSADKAVYRYQAAASRTSGSQTAASLFQLASGNTNAQGIADPPPNGIDLSPVSIETVSMFPLPRFVDSETNDRALAAWSSPLAAENLSIGSRNVASTRHANGAEVKPKFASSRQSARPHQSQVTSASQAVNRIAHLDRGYSFAVDEAFDDSEFGVITGERDSIFDTVGITGFEKMDDESELSIAHLGL